MVGKPVNPKCGLLVECVGNRHDDSFVAVFLAGWWRFIKGLFGMQLVEVEVAAASALVLVAYSASYCCTLYSSYFLRSQLIGTDFLASIKQEPLRVF